MIMVARVVVPGAERCCLLKHLHAVHHAQRAHSNAPRRSVKGRRKQGGRSCHEAHLPQRAIVQVFVQPLHRSARSGADSALMIWPAKMLRMNAKTGTHLMSLDGHCNPVNDLLLL
ncbi:hypothetical protein FOWG_16340 [Fusarium oxysporum f. sp. lycopersici MN25]|nr:hypothetical protein FOWG_16340 [Fusarium oxysporum f. sp. lycopersici MN25]EWZ79556.1 hypothetical protein FOWG_16340 [Fusarium oxysporum f. sp. lycopersici MN25]EWZ79557.1 hypothetical protein FOWG_16340 [Fusarium oxysporum f. sp. lycopersici MN25]